MRVMLALHIQLAGHELDLVEADIQGVPDHCAEYHPSTRHKAASQEAFCRSLRRVRTHVRSSTMRILSNPASTQVFPLLAQCGLSSDDIRSEYLPDFVVAMEGETPVGVAGLQVFGRSALVRSLGVLPSARSHGLGSQLLASSASTGAL
jgi:hypothetical protein